MIFQWSAKLRNENMTKKMFLLNPLLNVRVVLQDLRSRLKNPGNPVVNTIDMDKTNKTIKIYFSFSCIFSLLLSNVDSVSLQEPAMIGVGRNLEVFTYSQSCCIETNRL